MGEGLAWFAHQRGKNRNERSRSEHSHCVPVRGKPCHVAIKAESFSHRDAFGMILLAAQKYEV